MKIQSITKILQDQLTNMAKDQAARLIRSIPEYVVDKVKKRLYFTLTIPEDSDTYQAFEDWFLKSHGDKFDDVILYNFAKDARGDKKKKNDRDEIRNPYTGYREQNDFGYGIGYSQAVGSVVIKHNGISMRVTKQEKGTGIEGDMRKWRSYTIKGKNKRGIKAFVEDIYNEYNQNYDHIKVYVSDAYGSWNLVKKLKGKALDNIILNKDIHQRLTSDLENFDQDRSWYDNIGIPYKRGYLLYGPPGNGKTSLSIAIACKYNRNIYCLDVNKLKDDGALRAAFQCLQANSVLLIEDVDATFKKREAVTIPSAVPGKPGRPIHNVTFACLLNCLDGVYFKEGLITLMTTNIIGVLDQALIRPGRMDMKVFIDNPGQEEVETYLRKFYGKEIKLKRFVLTASMADVQGVCITHKNDMAAAIAELEADQLSTRLNDSVELIQLIEDIDGFRDTTKDNDDDDDDYETRLEKQIESLQETIDKLSKEGEGGTPAPVADAPKEPEPVAPAPAAVVEEKAEETKPTVEQPPVAEVATIDEESSLLEEAIAMVASMPALANASEETKKVAAKLYVAHKSDKLKEKEPA